jgi:hypothetical protein
MSNSLLPRRRERSEQRSEGDGCLPISHQIGVHRDAQAVISIKYISKGSSVSKILAGSSRIGGKRVYIQGGCVRESRRIGKLRI